MIYSHALSVICPESIFDAANTIAACIGEGGIHDLRSFTTVTLEGGYGLVNTRCKDGLYGALLAGQLALPDTFPIEGTDRDMNAAKAVLAGALILTEIDPENPPAWNGTSLLVGAGIDGMAMAAAYGLSRVSGD